MNSGVERIFYEREEQIIVRGFTPEHDDKHLNFELSSAAKCYLYAASYASVFHERMSEQTRNNVAVWPFEEFHWRPSINPIHNLEKAGALVAAEIDRLVRKRDSDMEKRLSNG